LSSPFDQKEVASTLQADFNYQVEKGRMSGNKYAAKQASPFEIDKGLAAGYHAVRYLRALYAALRSKKEAQIAL